MRMSDHTKDWLRGSLAGWAAAVLLGLLSFLGNEMRRDIKDMQQTITRDRERSQDATASQNARIGLVEYKLDLLTRSISDMKKPK